MVGTNLQAVGCLLMPASALVLCRPLHSASEGYFVVVFALESRWVWEQARRRRSGSRLSALLFWEAWLWNSLLQFRNCSIQFDIQQLATGMGGIRVGLRLSS